MINLSVIMHEYFNRRAFEPRRGSGGSSRADKRLVFSDTYAADGDRAESIWEGLPIACRDAAYEANRAATAFAATLPGHTCVIVRAGHPLHRSTPASASAC